MDVFLSPLLAQEAARPDLQQQTTRPDADGLSPQGGAARNAKRQGRPGETPSDATSPQAATDSKSGARQQLSKRGKPGEDLAKPDAAKPDPAKPDTAKPDTARTEAAKVDITRASDVTPATPLMAFMALNCGKAMAFLQEPKW
jgi:hypothetical protein